MDELLAKDLAFFHNNYAGSLTKRALGYARRFEDVFDVMSLPGLRKLPPARLRRRRAVDLLAVADRRAPRACCRRRFAMVFPLIRRRRRLVDVREAASNTLAGHVADSIANAEAVRAFAREPDEARIHARNVGDFGAKTLRSWDYQNMRVDMRHVADVRRHEHPRARRRAGRRPRHRAPASRRCSSRSATTRRRRA